MAQKDLKIFSLTRIKYNELYSDAIEFIKKTYGDVGQYFNAASPMGQLLQVVLNLGRMILYYIEDSITELNITTAARERSVRGLATLTGHNPSRGMGARGTLRMSYNMNSEYEGKIILIDNYTKLLNTSNNMYYTIVLSNDILRFNLTGSSKMDISIVQGQLKYQSATGTGYGLQSINFASDQTEIIDNYFVNVYVNGTKWRQVDSLLDMTYNDNAVMIKTSSSSGIDVFFGTGTLGNIPPEGSIITCEYLVTNGIYGNINDSASLGSAYWQFVDNGYLESGETVNLNEIFTLSSSNEILFGCAEENIEVTRQLAPHVSRSFVLANKDNYEYFLRKLNMFSVIDTIQGFNTINDNKLQLEYEDALAEYRSTISKYLTEINNSGASSEASVELYDQVKTAEAKTDAAYHKLQNAKLDDNTVYLFLIPDISARINDTDNYFTCSENAFKFTETEKESIVDLIEQSGQKIITVDNKIIEPKYPRFAINVRCIIWEGYEETSIKNEIIANFSELLINNKRRDRIPVSDFVAAVESIDGIDSVAVYFDADKNNAEYYGEDNYGLDDEFGDILLYRKITTFGGNEIQLNDIQPILRGGFTSKDGVIYGNEISTDDLGPLNIEIVGRSSKVINTKLLGA